MYTLIDEEAFYLVEDNWLHECYIDFILGWKEEKSYVYH
jgi:hypothetical protein